MKNAQSYSFKILFLFILLISCSSCCDHKTDVIVEPGEVAKIIISNDQAKELYDSYTERREELIENFEDAQDSIRKDVGKYDDPKQDQRTKTKEGEDRKIAAQQGAKGFQVVRFGFYDFEDLKKYMAFIEQEAGKANVNISTLRFYFGNYPDKEEFSNGKTVNEPRRNTFVMVPTVNTGNEEFAFFTADDDKDGLRKAFLLNDNFEKNGKSYRGNEKQEASLLPNSALLSPAIVPMPAQNEQSLSGNEFGLRPPK